MLRTLSILLILGMVWGAVNACDMSSGGVPLENVPLIRVPLDQISSMTFYRDGMTIGRRLAPTPQLKCNGGSAEGLAGDVESITCWNQNFTTTDRERYVPTWNCQNTVDTNYKLESPTIACEGFDHPGDPFILSGSCSLQYILNYKQAPSATPIQIIIRTHPKTFWEYFTPIAIAGICTAALILLAA